MNLQERLGELRREKNLPRPRVAEALGITTQEVMDWESGASVPTKEQTKALAKLYGVSVSELLDEEEVQKDPQKKVRLMWIGFGVWAAAVLGLIIIFLVQNFA